MDEQPANPFNWRLPLYGSAAAIIVVLPTMILGNGFGTFLATLVLGAIVGLIVLVVLCLTVHRRSRAALLMVAVFCAGCWLLFKVSDDVHTAGRWLLQAGRYKAEVLAQPNPPNRELKHAEWDSWGFAGLEDVVYLVFDPNDSLRGAAQNHAPGKYRGIPCSVVNVRHLEDHWYAVQLYANTDWDRCG